MIWTALFQQSIHIDAPIEQALCQKEWTNISCMKSFKVQRNLHDYARLLLLDT
jgi:hypothetical protein